MGYDLVPNEKQLTDDELDAISTMATYIVYDWGKRKQLIHELFYQIMNECNGTDINYKSILIQVRDHINFRIDALSPE